MHTGARRYKIPLLENKATCKVMNLIKLAHRHLNSAFLTIQRDNPILWYILHTCTTQRLSWYWKFLWCINHTFSGQWLVKWARSRPAPNCTVVIKYKNLWADAHKWATRQRRKFLFNEYFNYFLLQFVPGWQVTFETECLCGCEHKYHRRILKERGKRD